MKPSPPYGGLPARDDISLNLGPPNWRALCRGHNGNAALLHMINRADECPSTAGDSLHQRVLMGSTDSNQPAIHGLLTACPAGNR